MESNGLFIEEDTTRQGYIAESPGLHPALEFTYRPMTMGERSRQQRKAAKVDAAGDDDQLQELLAEALAEHLIAWSVDGEITKERLKTLDPNVAGKLHAIVAGRRASDAR